MIKQTRGAIKFLLADYRAVLKYAMMAAAGIALSSPSYATRTFDYEIYKFSESTDFDDSIDVQTKLTLENGDYTADSVRVEALMNHSPDHVPGPKKAELEIRNATLTTTTSSAGKHGESVFVQGKLSLTDATINPSENGSVMLRGQNAKAAFSGDVNINGDLYIGTRENAGALDIVLDGKDADGEINGLNLNISDELNIDGASLTIKGYRQGEVGATKDTFTNVNAKFVCLENNGQLTVGHNASLEIKGLYIENYSDKHVQQGALTVTDGGKLAITGDGYHGDDVEDDYVALDNYSADKDGNLTVQKFPGIIKVANNSEIVISHKDAVLYEPFECEDEEGPQIAYLPDQAFDIDNSSTLTISDLGAMTLAEVKELAGKLLYNGTGTLSGYTWAESEKKDGAISVDDALEYEHTDLLKDNVITGIKADSLTAGGAHNWGSAVLDPSADSLAVGADTSLKLSGAAKNDGKFVTNADGSVADVKLTSKATLILAGDGTVGNVKGGTGTLTTENGNVKAGSIDVDNLKMNSGSLNADSIDLKGNEDDSKVTGSSINVANNMNVKDITLKGSSLNIGGKLNVSGKLVADPTYVYAKDGITLGASGELNVLKDTVMINGTQASNVTSSSSANLILNKQLNLVNTNKVYLNGNIENEGLSSVTPTLTKVVTVGPNANLVLTGAAFADAGDGNAVLTTDSYEVQDGGQITLTNIKAAVGSAFKIFEGGNLDSSKLKVSNALYEASVNAGTATLAVKADAASVLNGVSNTTRDAILARANSTDANANYFNASEDSGLGVVSAALESSDVARTLNSFTGTVFAAYAPQNALLSSRAGTEAVEQRNGFRAQSGMGNVNGHDASVWVTPLYKRSSSDSFDIEGSKYGAHSNLYGLALGSDFAVADGWRLGADFNVGKGDSKSRGDLDYTKNDYKFFGFGLYGTYSYEKLNVLADIGYTKVSNDVEQSGVKSFDSDFDSQVFTAGVNAKYEFNTSAVDITPHLGVRYFRTKIDSYSVKGNGTEYLHGDSITGNLVEFPVGVSFSRNFKTDGWTVKPALDLSIIPAAGDRDLTAKTKVDGLSELSTTADVVDAVSFNGTLGLDIRNNDGTLGFGLGYGFTGSKNEKAHNVTANFRYNF